MHRRRKKNDKPCALQPIGIAAGVCIRAHINGSMLPLERISLRLPVLWLLLYSFALSSFAQEATGTLRGQVRDELGGLAPELDVNNEPVLDANGQTILVPITSIERYRRTLLFQRQGLTTTEVRARGGGATQFSITGGDPLAATRQLDYGAFIQDEWRVRQNLNLSLGLRYESQTNINNGLNLAPGQQIIPRNFGQGPSFFVVNLNVSRTFSFGDMPLSARSASQGNSQTRQGSGATPSSATGSAAAEKRYSLTLTLRAQNLFNRTNGSLPVGNLSSPLFGQSVSSAGSFGFGGVNPSAGNRRIEAQLRFTF